MRLLLWLLLVVFVSSCGVNSNLMLRTKKDFEYDEIPPLDETKEDVLAPNDVIEFRLFSNDGFQLIDMTSGVQTEEDQRGGARGVMAMRMRFTYNIEHDGLVKLPILGRVKLAGKTLREAELFLEEKYEKYYNRPFSIINIANKRVVIFPGQGGQATVINIPNNNTNLLEALALAGGITQRGKAKKIKVIRTMEDGSTKVFKVNLATIDGLEDGKMVVQANDIIYVEPFPDIAREILRDLTPIVSLISSVIIIYSATRTFSN